MAVYLISGPAVPALANLRHEIESARSRRLHRRADEKGRIQELDLDAALVAEGEARLGAAKRIIAGFRLTFGLARIGHLQMLDEAWQYGVVAARGLLRPPQHRKFGIGDPKYRIGHVHEARRRPQGFGNCGIRLFDPVQRLVEMCVDVDHAHCGRSLG